MKNSEKNKNMIRGIHYFSAEVKPKLMSSQGAALRSVGYIASYKLNFQNFQNWKFSSQGAALTIKTAIWESAKPPQRQGGNACQFYSPWCGNCCRNSHIGANKNYLILWKNVKLKLRTTLLWWLKPCLFHELYWKKWYDAFIVCVLTLWSLNLPSCSNEVETD